MKSVILNNEGELVEAVPVDLVEPVPAPAIDAAKGLNRG